MPYCGNNIYARDLKSNGGQESFGSSTDCFRKGFGIGYNTPIGDATRFIAEWGGPYKPYIVQSLYYGDGAVPGGHERATLGQSLSRGYALGRSAKAKALMRKIPAHPPKEQAPGGTLVRSHKWAK